MVRKANRKNETEHQILSTHVTSTLVSVFDVSIFVGADVLYQCNWWLFRFTIRNSSTSQSQQKGLSGFIDCYFDGCNIERLIPIGNFTVFAFFSVSHHSIELNLESKSPILKHCLCLRWIVRFLICHSLCTMFGTCNIRIGNVMQCLYVTRNGKQFHWPNNESYFMHENFSTLSLILFDSTPSKLKELL